MMGKSVFFSEGTAGQMKSAPSFAKDDDSTLPKEPNGSKIGLGPKPIWGMSVEIRADAVHGRKASIALVGQVGQRVAFHLRDQLRQILGLFGDAF
jgi:hypothetical protein